MSWQLVEQLGVTGWLLLAFAPFGVIVGLLTGWWAHRGRVWPVVPVFVFSLPAMLAVHGLAFRVRPFGGQLVGTDLAEILHSLSVGVGAHTLASVVALPGLGVLLLTLAIGGLRTTTPSRRTAGLVLAVGLCASLFVLTAGWATDELYLGKRRAGVVALAGMIAAVGSRDEQRPELAVAALGAVALVVGYVEMWWNAHVYTETLLAIGNVPVSSRLVLLNGAMDYIPDARPWQWAAISVPTAGLFAAAAQLDRGDPWHLATATGACIGTIGCVIAWSQDGMQALRFVEWIVLWG